MKIARPSSSRRLPRWVTVVLGIACVVVGVTLVTRPFQSLTVLIILVAAGFILSGLSDLIERSESPDPRTATATGIAWILGGLAVLVWPGLSLRTLAIVVGIAVIVAGVVRALRAFRADADQRAAARLLGAASLILGIVALGWPDITVLVVAVVFGMRMVLFGLARIGDAIRWTGPDIAAEAPKPPGRLRRYAKTAGAAVALVVSLALLVVSIRVNEGAPTVDASPAEVPADPGVLLRSESLSRAIPAGAQAWRILYTTTRAEGVPALASGLVVAPKDLPAGPRPVIAWAHGTTGVDESCAPSLLKDPFTAGATPALDQVVQNGWVMVATDYIGLGTEGPHGYLVGDEAGRAVLDSVRAARQLSGLSLADETVVWGHSQGGGAALWTGILAPANAPGCPRHRRGRARARE